MTKALTFTSARTAILFGVGIGLVVWNAVFGNQNWATFVVGLMFCGFPLVLNVDQALRAQTLFRPASPGPDTARETETVT